MADLNEVIKEIQEIEFKSPIDAIREKYLAQLSEYTKRNTICYYSGFLNHRDHPDTGIDDKDINGFMTAINKLDKKSGLDLIIHSPGGEVTATEAIGDYLRNVFGNNIRVFVPQLAMSGGTMLSFIGKELYMGKHSSIGPIDPHFSGLPAYGIIQEYEQAKKEVTENPSSIEFWRTIISKYHPAFIGQCYKAIELSGDIAKKWLQEGEMFSESKDKDKTIEKVMNHLNNNEFTKLHSRHIDIKEAKSIGLNVKALEQDDKLQDLVLSIHHCFMLTFQNTNAVKIIENQNGTLFVMNNSTI